MTTSVPLLSGPEAEATEYFPTPRDTSTDKPSCANCPSMLAAHDTVARFGKSTRAPMCGRFGTLLDRPGFTPKQTRGLQQRIASGCKSYGEPLPSEPSAYAHKVAIPLVDSAATATTLADPLAATSTDTPLKVSSCTSCQFYLRPEIVRSTYGWAAGMCQAKGVLVMPHKTTEAAADCAVAVPGKPTAQKGLTLIDFYTPEYYHVDLFKTYGTGVTHPLQHPTDAPVTAEDTARGILAWRKIADPSNGTRFVLLPIFDPAQFSPDDVAKIPQPGDDEHPELYLDHGNVIYRIAVSWMALDETPMAWGPAGTGKSEVARHLAYLMQLPFERFSITASTELDDLAGKMMFIDNETRFAPGRLPLAWQRPCVILLDEPNTGQPDVWQFLRPLTDNSKQLVLDASSGETVTRHRDTHLMMAANPSWDPLNVGAQTIGDADSSRLMHIRFALPPADLERKIIAARVALDGWEISDDLLHDVINTGTDIRANCAEGVLSMSWGVRSQIKVARALRWFSPIVAYRMATDDLEPTQQSLVLEAVKANFGDDATDEEGD